MRVMVLFCFAAFPFLINAQPVAVRAYTDKNKVLLGEPFWLMLEVKAVNGVKPPSFKVDSIPHFEFIIKDSVKVITHGDTSIYQQLYQLTSFDSGRWVIPQYTLRPFVKTNSVLVDVVYTDGFDPKLPYHDVQEVKNVPLKLNANAERWWYWIFGSLIIIVLLLYWFTKEAAPKKENKIVVSDAAYKKAMRSLQDLKSSGADHKKYYTQLIEIFRAYIFERTGISSLQQTSNDLAQKIKSLINNEEKYNSLTHALYEGDMVKFAKYDPDDNVVTTAFCNVKNAIEYIEAELKSVGAKHTI